MEKDHAEAVTWMRKAAEQGDCRAMRNLATRFSIGVEPDHAGRTGTGERWQRRRNKSGIAQGSGVCRWGERQMKKISNPHLCSVAGGRTREGDWETGRQPSFTIKRKTRKMARDE